MFCAIQLCLHLTTEFPTRCSGYGLLLFGLVYVLCSIGGYKRMIICVMGLSDIMSEEENIGPSSKLHHKMYIAVQRQKNDDNQTSC
jgi:hypothetical protein